MKVFIPLLTAWLIWVSQAIVNLQADVAVIKSRDISFFVPEKQPGPRLTKDADLNIFKFFLKGK